MKAIAMMFFGLCTICANAQTIGSETILADTDPGRLVIAQCYSRNPVLVAPLWFTRTVSSTKDDLPAGTAAEVNEFISEFVARAVDDGMTVTVLDHCVHPNERIEANGHFVILSFFTAGRPALADYVRVRVTLRKVPTQYPPFQEVGVSSFEGVLGTTPAAAARQIADLTVAGARK